VPRHALRIHSTWLLLGLALAFVVGTIALARQLGDLQFLELAAYDLLVATDTRGSPWKPPIIVINVTEADIHRLGNWPLNDDQLASTLESLLRAGPRVIGLDIYRDLPVPPGTKRLHRLLQGHPQIIAIEKFPGAGSPGIPPPPVLAGTDRVGFSDLVSDPGGIIRRNLLFQANDTEVGYSFSLRLALAYLAADGVYPQPGAANPAFLRLGSVTLVPLEGNEGGYVGADAGGYQILLDYIGGPDPFRHFSLGAWLDGHANPDLLRDRIVIIGVASESVKDRFITPHAILGGHQGDQIGSVMHAHAVWQLLEAALHGRVPMATWSNTQELGWLLLWSCLGLLAGWLSGSVLRLTAGLGLGASALLSICALAFRTGWWIPSVPPLLGLLGAASLSTALRSGRRRREQQVLMGLFARHVSPQVAETIWAHRDEVLEGGRIRPQVLTATVLFTDLQGFTQVSETMAPELFLEWLNSYMGAMTDVIMHWGGVLDDYAGDGIKANFGVPLARGDSEQVAEDARRAVGCALALMAELNRLNRAGRAEGRPCVAMRVGIHTGSVVVGTVGSRLRMKYTTVGSDVNLASRLESLREITCPDPDDEQASCRILVSAATARLLGDSYRMKDLGCFQLRGISHEIGVFSIETAAQVGGVLGEVDNEGDLA
jgi:adenylate cyclase